MTSACYKCKHCNTKGHLAKDCTEMREQAGNSEAFEAAGADLLLMDDSEEEEEEGGSGFNDIRMIFDDDTDEEEEDKENASRSFGDESVEIVNEPEENYEDNLNTQR